MEQTGRSMPQVAGTMLGPGEESEGHATWDARDKLLSREDEKGLGTARIRGDLTWHTEVCCPHMRGSEGPQRAGEFSVLCGPCEAVYTSW